MGQFLYFNVDNALRKMRSWESDGKPEYDGWYPHKMNCVACIPYLAVQSDGYSDAAKEDRKWSDRFKMEEVTMKYALRDFFTDHPSPADSQATSSAPLPLVSS
jgi:hypothetical protein